MTAGVENLAHDLSRSIADLKSKLEQHQIDDIEASIAKVQVAMDAFQRHPGGMDELLRTIDLMEPAPRDEMRGVLRQIKLEYEVCGQLIKLAMQRNAALQAYAAQNDAAAIYSAQGGVSMVAGSKLLGKF
jgi:hypothetical protein